MIVDMVLHFPSYFPPNFRLLLPALVHFCWETNDNLSFHVRICSKLGCVAFENICAFLKLKDMYPAKMSTHSTIIQLVGSIRPFFLFSFERQLSRTHCFETWWTCVLVIKWAIIKWLCDFKHNEIHLIEPRGLCWILLLHIKKINGGSFQCGSVSFMADDEMNFLNCFPGLCFHFASFCLRLH